MINILIFFDEILRKNKCAGINFFQLRYKIVFVLEYYIMLKKCLFLCKLIEITSIVHFSWESERGSMDTTKKKTFFSIAM